MWPTIFLKVEVHFTHEKRRDSLINSKKQEYTAQRRN